MLISIMRCLELHYNIYPTTLYQQNIFGRFFEFYHLSPSTKFEYKTPILNSLLYTFARQSYYVSYLDLVYYLINLLVDFYPLFIGEGTKYN